MDNVFWWVGYIAVALFAIAGLCIFAVWVWVNFCRDRFNTILFRKTERRISLASWYNARLMSDEHFMADDFPVCERPFYLSYRIGRRRAFLMLGFLEPHRHAVIRGKHPVLSEERL